MQKAIEKAIYYSRVLPSYEPIVSFNYTDKESLYQVIAEYNKSIDVRTLFGETICNKVITTLPYLYDSLLLGSCNKLYIVNRQDYAICLINEEMKDDNVRVGIIKVDAVQCEYRPGWGKWVVGLSAIVSIAATSYYFRPLVENS